MKSQSGFTLMELMIAIALAAIFVTLAVPGFNSIIQNNRAVTLTNSLAASLNFARSEAVKRGVTVSMCASGNTTQTTCGGAGDWTNGWIVFVDDDGDGVLDGGETTLRVRGEFEPGTTFNSASSVISYNPTGFVDSGSGNFDISATGCTAQNGRTISLSNTGRISITHNYCP